MIGSLSFATVLVSALVSIITGYVGALLSSGGVRRQERRIYGLALLAEVKSIQRSLLRYQKRIDALDSEDVARLRNAGATLGLWRQDLSVYANNSGRIGLFRARTAVEIIEFYHRVRWLELRAAELDMTEGPDAPTLGRWIDVQRTAIHTARLHSRYLSRLLRHEVPATTGEVAKALRRLRIRHAPVRPKAGLGPRGAFKA
jgi:hypothetical protein